MAITFDFVQDFRKYREFITYVSKVDEAVGKLPFQFYQGDMLDCFIIEKKDDIVIVTMSNNTDKLKDSFIEDAQPDTFDTIPEGIAYLYDINKHELIYNFDAKKPSSLWNWSTYPEVFWISEDQGYDHGLVLGIDGKPCRLYLSNRRLMSLFVGLQDLNSGFPNLFAEGNTQVTLEPDGVATVLSIIAGQLGQDEPKMNDVKTAISCDLINPTGERYAKYNFKNVIELFNLKGNEDDLWEDTWGAAVGEAIAIDDMKDTRRMSGNLHTPSTLGGLSGYTSQLCMSELADLGEVPITDKPIYVHMDIPIHGIHYMTIEPNQIMAIFFDDLIIRDEDIYQHFENLPQDQLALHGDYESNYDDDLGDLDKSGTINTSLEDKFDNLEDQTLPESYEADSDEELGLSGGKHS